MGGVQSFPQDIDVQCQQSLVYILSQCRFEDVSASYRQLEAGHYSGPESCIESHTLSKSLPVNTATSLDLLAILSGDDSEPVDIVGCFSTLLFFCHGSLSEKLDLLYNVRGWKKQETVLSSSTVQACFTELLHYTDRVYSADPWMKHSGEWGTSKKAHLFSADVVKELESSTGNSTFTFSDLHRWLMASSALSSHENISQGKNGAINENASNNAVSSVAHRFTYHTWFPVECDANCTPSARSKHAIAVNGNYIYLYGGRDGSIGHKDLWRFEISTNRWQRVQCRGDRPNLLQEHSMIAHKGRLYIFGGEFSASWSKDVPLWILDLATLVWIKHSIPSEVSVPSSRRGQTAVVFGNAMHIYGGYMDLKGSSSELWTFDLEAEMWHLAYSSSMSADGPGSRHGHSAEVHDKSMWVFGGMSDLQPKGDLWRWDFGVRKWTKIRTKNGPPPLVGHSSCKVPGALLFYGGESLGVIQSDIWKFVYETQTWQKILCSGVVPCGRFNHEAIVLPSFIVNQAWLASGTDRAQSVPYLQASQTAVRLDPRPSTSPVSRNTNQDKPATRHNFRNKVLPTTQDAGLTNYLKLLTVTKNNKTSAANDGINSESLNEGPNQVSSNESTSRFKQLKGKLDPSRSQDSVQILNEEAMYSEENDIMNNQHHGRYHRKGEWSDVVNHAYIVRKHIKQIARFKRIDTGSLSRLLSSTSDTSEDCYQTYENPMYVGNQSESYSCAKGVGNRLRSVSVESILSMSHNEELPPPYWLDYKKPRLFEKDLLKNAIHSKSWESLLKNFGGVRLKYVDISEDPAAIELQSMDSDMVVEDLEGYDTDMFETYYCQRSDESVSKTECSNSVPSGRSENFGSTVSEGNNRFVLDAWRDHEPKEMTIHEEHYATETPQNSNQNLRARVHGEVKDMSERPEGDNSNQVSDQYSGERHVVKQECDTERTAPDIDSDQIEMQCLDNQIRGGRNHDQKSKRDSLLGQTLKTYISQRGVRTCELVHMFVFGGKESESCNIGIKPLPIWRLDIRI